MPYQPVARGGRAGKLKGSKTRNVQTTQFTVRSPNKVPHNNVLKGLKMPAGGGGADQIQRRLKAKSPWYSSILDPLHGADCKIPDATGVETGTLQSVWRTTIQTSAGLGGIRMATPYPTGDITTGNNIQTLNLSTSSNSNIQWTGDDFLFDTNASLVSLTQGVRVVSAALYIQSEASLATNSGKIIAYMEPFPQINIANGLPVTYYENRYKSVEIPINNNRPAEVRWFPLKRDEFMYDSFYTPSLAVPPKWEIGFLIVGASVTETPTFDVIAVVNYEFIPVENTVNILDAKPSPVDAQEIDLVENWVQDMDVGTMTTTKTIASSPSSVSPSHDDYDSSGFGMFFHVISELAPLALGLL